MLLLTATLARAADSDLDTVDDRGDRCAWEDDTIDLDSNKVADCYETVLADFGMATAPTTQANWMDWTGAMPAWSSWDANGYAYSGSAYLAPAETGSLYYAHCIQVTPGTRHAVMGEFGTDTYDSMHQLVVVEYSGASCGRKSSSQVVASAHRAAGASSVTLVGTYVPSGFSIRSVMVYATFDNYGAIGTAWFDHVSLHP